MSFDNADAADGQAAINSYSLEEIMSEDVLTAYEGWSIKRLAGFFVKHNISAVPVVASDDELVGVVSLSDVVRFDSRERTDTEMKNLVWMYCGMDGGALSESDLKHLKNRASETYTVNSIMTPDVISVDISSSSLEVCSLFIERDVHHIYVIKNKKLTGVVTAMDVLRAIMNQ